MGNNRIESSGAVTESGFRVEKVEINRLDDYDITGCTLLKIDAEGSELEVLKGAKATILKFKPVIWIELHENSTLETAGYAYRRKDIIGQLASSGYRSFFGLDNTNFLFAPSKKVLFRRLEEFTHN